MEWWVEEGTVVEEGMVVNLFIHLMSQVEKSVPKPERKRSMTQTKSDWTVKKTREVSNGRLLVWNTAGQWSGNYFLILHPSHLPLPLTPPPHTHTPLSPPSHASHPQESDLTEKQLNTYNQEMRNLVASQREDMKALELKFLEENHNIQRSKC